MSGVLFIPLPSKTTPKVTYHGPHECVRGARIAFAEKHSLLWPMNELKAGEAWHPVSILYLSLL
jgi:hypothetical protein